MERMEELKDELKQLTGAPAAKPAPGRPRGKRNLSPAARARIAAAQRARWARQKGTSPKAEAKPAGRRKRTMSPAARARISAAAKARWARAKAAGRSRL